MAKRTAEERLTQELRDGGMTEAEIAKVLEARRLAHDGSRWTGHVAGNVVPEAIRRVVGWTAQDTIQWRVTRNRSKVILERVSEV